MIFIHNVLKIFKIVENNLGFYRQIGGLAMGTPLSGPLSNIFVHLMEDTVINKLLKNKTVVHWQRFADDVLCICKKDAVQEVLNKINALNSKLTFSVEKMMDDEIKFLDARIFLENETIKFRKFFKRGVDTVFTNFQLSVSPY